MRRTVLVLTALVSLFVCSASRSAAQLTSSHRAALADTLRREAQKFADGLTSLDGPAVVALFSDKPDFTYFDNGRKLDKPGVLGVANNFFGNTKTLNGRWQPSDVVILTRDSGQFWGVFKADDNSVSKTGEPVWATDGKSGAQLWSFTYRRRDTGGWEIVHVHQTRLSTARINDFMKAGQ